MTDREKLIEMIKGAPGTEFRADRNLVQWGSFDPTAEQLADHLIANGVTVRQPLTVAERADIERICRGILWKLSEMRKPGMWERYTKNMECGELREFAQHYRDMETVFKALTGHEVPEPPKEE